MRGRPLVLAGLLTAGLLAVASPAAAHPLGNATVSRALALELHPGAVRITAIVDMAEIPAFAAMVEIDADGDGFRSKSEQATWGGAACRVVAAAIRISVDGADIETTAPTPPEVGFPPGVGGLETLRLVCRLAGSVPDDGAEHRLVVVDQADDAARGWREITIVGSGVELVESDVPSVSPSALLTSYPDDLLTTPANVRSGTATYGPTSGAAAQAVLAQPGPIASAAASDPLADLLAVPRTPIGWVVALALALGLGAAHAVSPGHGKALIAAYAVGSRSSIGHAVGLGLSVAASHTIGVLVLGAVVLTASELLVPERVVAWLSVGSGVLVIVVGAMVAGRSLRRTVAGGHPHPHEGGGLDHHHHGTDGDHHNHDYVEDRGPSASRARRREILALGLVGGAIPSTSALLVLLVAVATGQVAQGLVLICAFGAGMAIVLGGLAAITGVARSRLGRASGRLGPPWGRRLVAVAPLVSAVVIMAVGAVTAIGALGSLL